MVLSTLSTQQVFQNLSAFLSLISLNIHMIFPAILAYIPHKMASSARESSFSTSFGGLAFARLFLEKAAALLAFGSMFLQISCRLFLIVVLVVL